MVKIRSIGRALARFGGALVAPRATVVSLPPQQGRRDGVWLSLLYLGVTSIYPVAEGFANWWATRNLGGILMILSAFGRALILPIVALVASETILGRGRAYRRGLALVPMVLVALVLRQLPWRSAIGWPYVPEALGMLVVVGWTLWVRTSVPEEADA